MISRRSYLQKQIGINVWCTVIKSKPFGSKPVAAQSNTKPEVPDYTMIRVIGEGGYGQVWLARTVTGQYRAVKIISSKNSSLFDREFEAIQAYEPISRSHNGLVDILHVGIDKRHRYFYYVMELADCADPCSGQFLNENKYRPKTLSLELKLKNHLPALSCIRIVLKLTDALQYLHAQHLIHRDIKPSNILFYNGNPKLADIGLVVPMGEPKTSAGTPGYIAPDNPLDCRSDIYSLGMVFYVISLNPFPNAYPTFKTGLNLLPKSEQDVLFKINTIVTKACDKDPNKRYQSACDMHKALKSMSTLTRSAPVIVQRRSCSNPVNKSFHTLLNTLGSFQYSKYKQAYTKHARYLRQAQTIFASRLLNTAQ